MMKQLEKYLMPLAEKIGRNKYLMSIRDGFLVSTPLLIAGSIFLLIANFPIAAWTKFLESTIINICGNGYRLFICWSDEDKQDLRCCLCTYVMVLNHAILNHW